MSGRIVMTLTLAASFATVGTAAELPAKVLATGVFTGGGGSFTPNQGTLDFFMNVAAPGESPGAAAGNTLLMCHVPKGKGLAVRQKLMNPQFLFTGQPWVLAVSGRLTVETDPKLGKISFFQFGNSQLQLGENKRLVLIADTIAELSRANQRSVPKQGLVRVEGTAANAAKDLKIGDADFLAIRNGDVPILLFGQPVAEKPKNATRIQATGTLEVVDGVVRVMTDNVEAAK